MRIIKGKIGGNVTVELTRTELWARRQFDAHLDRGLGIEAAITEVKKEVRRQQAWPLDPTFYAYLAA